jgi:hypothetical protein
LLLKRFRTSLFPFFFTRSTVFISSEEEVGKTQQKANRTLQFDQHGQAKEAAGRGRAQQVSILSGIFFAIFFRGQVVPSVSFWLVSEFFRSYRHWHFPHVVHPFLSSNRKDAKKVSKLESQIPYHESRGDTEKLEKIKNEIEEIWEKARAAAGHA